MLAERAVYAELVAQGVRTGEACRLVGVSPRTGYRWRQEAAAAAAVAAAGPLPVVVSARYLSQDERVVIADRLRAGVSQSAIAAELGRPRSTVSREIARNQDPAGGGYQPFAAQQRAERRRPRPKPRKLAGNPALRDLVQELLASRHSPRQISARLRRDFPDRNELRVSHETIYQALYVQGRGALRRELAAALRTGRAVRRPRTTGTRPSRFTAPMLMISDRPAEADDRAIPGHWEGDLIIGKDGRSAIGTLVERATRYVLLVHLGTRGRSAETVRDALLDTVATLPQHLKRSLTWDQGAEMALHHQFTLAANMPVFFCDPHSPWQRGSNENTNGLLRQYFPKGTNLAGHTPEHLAAVAAELNSRPRQTLGWDTPAERLAQFLTTN
ncbi:IS30 family transposase [Dactylosporangium sp. NPDC051485]|uniref:IS30 family transposase n=1 Tax=Dactylosporangium sp. NPDC051485 TaxID=3154846 RepID=UPI00342937A7